MLSGVGDCMIVRPREGRCGRRWERVSRLPCGRGAAGGREAVGGGFRQGFGPFVGWNREGRFAVLRGGWFWNGGMLPGRVHAIAFFFRKKIPDKMRIL